VNSLGVIQDAWWHLFRSCGCFSGISNMDPNCQPVAKEISHINECLPTIWNISKAQEMLTSFANVEWLATAQHAIVRMYGTIVRSAGHRRPTCSHAELSTRVDCQYDDGWSSELEIIRDYRTYWKLKEVHLTRKSQYPPNFFRCRKPQKTYLNMIGHATCVFCAFKEILLKSYLNPTQKK